MKETKRVLVSGGAGFIGSHVTELLCENGHEVAVIDNLKNGKKEFIGNLEVTFFEKDIRDRLAIREIVQQLKPQWIFHLAAIHFIPYCQKYPIESFEINALGTQILLDELAKVVCVEKVFFASTAAVYGPSDNAHQETEDYAPMDAYGVSKVCGESMVHRFIKDNSSKALIGRLFNAIGPRETNPHLLPDIFEQVNAGDRTINLGNIEPKRDFVDVRDMARAIVGGLSNLEDKFQVCNIGSGKQYSVKEVVDIISELLGEEIEIVSKADRRRKVERPSLLAGNQKISDLAKWRPEYSLKQTLKDLLVVE